MRRGIGIGIAGVVALSICGAAAVSSAAALVAQAGATEIQKPNTKAFVYLGKSRGYDVGISMPNPRVAVLSVFKLDSSQSLELGEPEAYTEASYGVRVPSGPLNNGAVRAHFPSLGRVSLRFDPSGQRRVHRLPSDCRGKRRVTEYGKFRGTISLKGEGGYFELQGRSGKGTLERSFRLVCGKGQAKNEDVDAPMPEFVAPAFSVDFLSVSSTIALLYGLAKREGRSIGIRAAHREGDLFGAEVQALTFEWKKGVAIGRSVRLRSAVPGTLTTSMPGVHPAFATLAPPVPFYGEGNFLESSPTSHSWTGTLGVQLPGLDLALTGAGFKTSLCVVSPLKVPQGCDFIKPKPLR